MKKRALIVSLLAGIVAGGVATYFIVSGSQPAISQSVEVRERIVEVPAPAAGSHFTTFQPAAYPDLTYAAENAVQAVVNIEVVQQVTTRGRLDPFLELFGLPQGYSREPQTRERKSGGSGVIITHDGYIVTNHHVVDNATSMRVKLYDGRIFDARLVGTDPTTEVALVKIDATGLPTLPFGSSDDLRLGEWVLAIGSPFDLQSTITAGIVSAKARNLGAIGGNYSVESFIQTDAAVNPGNSGGALVNTRGELVGINTLIKSATGVYMGYSFAIPSAIVQKVVMDLREYGVAQRALLGISYVPVDQDFVENEGAKHKIRETGGVFVASVDPSGAAHAAGIREGDVLTSVEGVELDARANLGEIIARYRPNDRVKIIAKRGGQVKHFDVVLRNKVGTAELLTKDHVDVSQVLGGTFAEVSARAKSELKLEHGVVVTSVREGGVLSRVRVRTGFIITHINENPVRNVADIDRVKAPVTSIEGTYSDGRNVIYSIVQ
jgi:Do/DeqQ family serine protease